MVNTTIDGDPVEAESSAGGSGTGTAFSQEDYDKFRAFLEYKKEMEAVLLGLFCTSVNFVENDTRERKGRVTSIPHKLYLDSCVSYHTMFDAFWLEITSLRDPCLDAF